MKPWPRRWHHRRPPLINTGIEVRVNGQVVLGPMTFGQLALIGRFGGYGDLLPDVWWADGARTEIILHPPEG